MKQILNHLRTGEIELAELPAPSVERGHLLIRTRVSLVSQGTEKMLVQFGKASLFQKARSQPDRVRQVLTKIRTEGLLPTVEAVFRKLDEPLPLGYCNAGVVVGVGSSFAIRGPDVRVGGSHPSLDQISPLVYPSFRIGDRVASNGPHAEIVSVPSNLVAKIPDNVSDSSAAFAVIGAIGLQGIRLLKPELGETFVVIGLGLIGQIAAQLLKLHGCSVIGFDFDPAKVAKAREFGILAMPASGEFDSVKWVLQQTHGLGADGVLITAATSSHEVISLSARMSRKRGRIVLVGVVGLNINRADFYEKELTFQVSCSYGPGRYDDVFEEKGYDYPPAYVRWTENRNFQAVLEAISSGKLEVAPLITRSVPLERYREVYDDIEGGGLASLLVYGSDKPADSLQLIRNVVQLDDIGAPWANNRQLVADSLASTIRVCERNVGPAALALIGAGNFSKMIAMPALADANAPVKIVVSGGGVTGNSLAKKYKVPFSSTNYSSVLADPDIRGVIITTRHNLHATQTIEALRARKHVLVEKPLCLTLDELTEIETVIGSRAPVYETERIGSLQSSDSSGRAEPASGQQIAGLRTGGAGESLQLITEVKTTLSVGYNRRFSPHVEKMKTLLSGCASPISIVATMNAGAIPLNHWVHDPEVGGGRILGEACHFIDLAIHLTNSLVVEVSATQLEGATDSASILLRHADGSTSVVNYFAHGHRDVSKERIEVHSMGRTLLLDNFRELRGYGFNSFSKFRTRQDKGHSKQFALFATRVRENGEALIPWDHIRNGTAAAFAALRAIRERRVVSISEMN